MRDANQDSMKTTNSAVGSHLCSAYRAILAPSMKMSLMSWHRNTIAPTFVKLRSGTQRHAQSSLDLRRSLRPVCWMQSILEQKEESGSCSI